MRDALTLWRRQAATAAAEAWAGAPQPRALAKGAFWRSAAARVMVMFGEPLRMIARSKSGGSCWNGSARGCDARGSSKLASIAQIIVAPLLCPAAVTRLASPPKDAAFSRAHRIAAAQSITPKLPLAPDVAVAESSAVAMKPRGPTR
jgi:hypothetical protein